MRTKNSIGPLNLFYLVLWITFIVAIPCARIGHAQKPKLTTSTGASDKYGQGGTLESTSDEKTDLVVRQVWKNKDGFAKEIHDIFYRNNKVPHLVTSESWTFSKDGEKTYASYFLEHPPGPGKESDWEFWGHSPTGESGTSIERKSIAKAEAHKLIQQIEDQFADEGKIDTPWAPKEKEVETKVEQPIVRGEIDACLLGSWLATDVKPTSQFITGGGTGFRVSFKKDRTESVDYSGIKAFEAGPDRIDYTGTATGVISTKDQTAKVEKVTNAGVTMKMNSVAGHFEQKLSGLGPGGLGNTVDDNSYKCTETTLIFHTSTQRVGKANVTVTLTKIK